MQSLMSYLHFLTFGSQLYRISPLSSSRAVLCHAILLTLLGSLALLAFSGFWAFMGGLLVTLLLTRITLDLVPFFGRFQGFTIFCLRVWLWTIWFLPLEYYR